MPRLRLHLFLVVALSACGGTAADSTSAALAQQWLSSTSESQRTALEDREVTAAEYERALLDTAVCLNAIGFSTGQLRDLPDGIRADFMVLQGDHSDAEVAEAWNVCWEEHFNAVESVYLAQHARRDVSNSTLEGELRDCLADSGLADVPAGLQDFELVEFLTEAEASTAAWFCRESHLIAKGELGATPPD